MAVTPFSWGHSLRLALAPAREAALRPAAERPLVLLSGWMGATDKQLRRYKQLYHDCGIDIMSFAAGPSHVLRPEKAIALVEGNMRAVMQELEVGQGTALVGRGSWGAGGGGGGLGDGLFAQQERGPIRGRPAVRGKRTYGGWPGQRVEEQGSWASRTQNHSEAGYGRPVDRGVWTAKTVKRPRQQPAQPPIRRLLGAADAQTAHPATSSTAPTHQRLGSKSTSRPADRKQRPDATCEGKNG